MPRVESVEIRGVTRVYGGRPVLRGVSTRFVAGSVTFLEGANGAGKSTLLGVIGTLVRPSAGTVVYAPLGTDGEAVRGELGWLAHEGRIHRELTARENVSLAARLLGLEAAESFARVAARVGIEAFADQAVATLSRGQRQRVALARALVHSPSLLLLDEPLTGLDAEGADRVAELLVAERARGTVVIVVSHAEGFAARVGGRRIRLERGRIVSETEA